RDFADIVLGKFAERKFAARELLLGKAPEKVGLILCGIERAQKLISPRHDIEADAGVVARREAVGSNLASHAEQRLKLHIGVAVGTRDGRTAAQIVADEGADDALFKLLLEIDDIMRKVQVLRDAPGVIDVVEGAAAVLGWAVSLEF